MPKRNDGDTDQPLAAGWYPDPWSATGEGERYFDGKKWGSSARPLGRHTQTPPAPGASVTSIKAGKRRKVGRFTLPRRKGGGFKGGWAGFRNKYGPLMILIGLVLLVWGVPKLLHSGNSNPEVFVEPEPTPSTVPTNRPPPGAEEADQPLGAPAPVPAGTGKFEFLRHQPGDPATPVAFDPCRPIHYVINPAGAPPDGASLVAGAIERVQTATGLHFIDDGATTEKPDKQRESYLPDRYDPARWAPVLIAWSDEAAYAPLAGYIIGVTDTAPFGDDKHRVLVSGQIVFDKGDLSVARKPDRQAVRAVMLHELGHLVGLDHTADQRQMMYSEELRVRDYANGDLQGLAELGTQSCFPNI